MSKKLTKQVHEVWLEMDATITSCELVVGTGLLTDVQVPSRYRISFCYGVAGQAFYGSYNARSPQELRFYHQPELQHLESRTEHSV